MKKTRGQAAIFGFGGAPLRCGAAHRQRPGHGGRHEPGPGQGTDERRDPVSPEDGYIELDRMLEELEKQFNSLLAEASAAGGTEDYAERFRMISNAMADLKEHKSRIKQVYQENELVSQRLKAASIAMSAYAAELTEWDQSVVYQLVEKVTVLAKDKIRVTFRNGTEVEQEIEQLDWRNAS